MKKKNFPERKNRRRKRVIMNFENKKELSKREKKEFEILKKRVEPDRRGERSKKIRHRA